MRERMRQAEVKLSKKKEENDPLFQFIIDSFKEEMQRVSYGEWAVSTGWPLMHVKSKHHFKTWPRSVGIATELKRL